MEKKKSEVYLKPCRASIMELPCDASLWNQYIFIAFNIFSCKSSIIYCKILIIAVVSDERTNELRIYAKLCRNVIIFYRQQLASLCQVQEKFRVCGTASLRMTVI